VVLLANLPSGGVRAVEGHVRGLFSTIVKAYDDSALRVPLPLANKLLGVSGAHIWVTLLQRTEDTEKTMRQLHGKLDRGKFELIPWTKLADFYNKTVVLFSHQFGVVQGIIGAIIILGISNTMMMSVMERTGEIGTIMALGTRRRQLLGMFLSEGLLLGILGAAIGLGLGFGLAHLISAIGIPMPPPPGMDRALTGQIRVTPALALESMLLAVTTTLIASVYPAWKASRLTIVDALRHNR
jgi:putative ABC transport system permease protein